MSMLNKNQTHSDFLDWLKQLTESIHKSAPFDYELMLEQLYSKLIEQGDTVIDIGAHTGRHLKNFVNLVGDQGYVVAFEPLPFAFETLVNTYSKPNVALNNVALSDTKGVSEFVYATGTPEESG